ncbi:Exonuclease RNase T/DNA polymerase III, partial [Trinorchestia longiramus]
MDCEMLYTDRGLEVGRLTIIGANCGTVLDTYILPQGNVVCYNEKFSGLRPESFAKALSFEQARYCLLNIVKRRDILLGHSLQCDLIAMRVVHQRVVDTSLLFGYKDGKRTALKKLCELYLPYTIQDGSHSSESDALAALDLTIVYLQGSV